MCQAARVAPTPETAVLVDGPWQHREISANGARFHIAEAGSGPLVLLLHGFPEFWWSWHHQLVGLAAAGFRAVAPDLRGYGASDKPPRGYDAYTLSADVAGLVRALGERDAVVVGADWGGALAWSVAALHRQVVRRLVVFAMPHPLRLRAAMTTNSGGQFQAASHIAKLQLPRLAEKRMTAADGALVGRWLHDWGGPGFPDQDTESLCRQAIQVPGVAHCAAEYFRWAVRSQSRPSGHRFARLLRAPVTAPTLQLHGAADSCMLPGTAMGSGRYVAGRYEWRLLPGVGHFPHQERPDLATDELCRWAGLK